MGFASSYLEQQALFPAIIKEAPEKDTGIIVVVPACNEPGIKKLLDSLILCHKPECKTEVIVVVNASANAPAVIIENNRITIENIESWKRENPKSFFRLFAFIAEPFVKGWGVGLARKTGMDEALYRFNNIDKSDGVILNLDADCEVEKNYFVSVCDELLKKKEWTACSIYFEHPLSGNEFPTNIYESITLYELHLRYYLQGLLFSGFPNAFHTVGSAIAVKALAYIKAGGMNRRQAGEDFYFIQKLVPQGGYFNLNSTTVYPSPRISSRVPFGTGASMGKLTEANIPELLTYDIQAFKELRDFFEIAENIFYCDLENLHEFYKTFPVGIRLFLNEEEWIYKMEEIKRNTSSPGSFRKRFFSWFNMFRIVKYLNFVHSGFMEKKPVIVSASELLETIGIISETETVPDLLHIYRSLEKKS